MTRSRLRRSDPRPSPLVLLGAALALLLVGLPIVGLLWRAPWSGLGEILGQHDLRTALRLSLQASVGATVLSALLGLPLAWVLARAPLPGRRVVRALAILPMVMPPVVGGIGLLTAFGRNGLLGRLLLDWFDVSLPYTTNGAVLAATFVAMPFLVVTAEAAFRSADRDLEEAARTLGARPSRVFWTVTFPACRPALAAGLVLCWARALGEFGATITFAGNFPGTTRTMPIAIYLAFQGSPQAAIALSLVLLGVSLAVLVALRERWLGALR